MAYSSADFVQDMSRLAAEIGIPQKDIDDLQMLACALAYRLGYAEGKKRRKGKEKR